MVTFLSMSIIYMNLDRELTKTWHKIGHAFGLGGNMRGGVNREGITYYNNLINELLSNGLIQSFYCIDK